MRVADSLRTPSPNLMVHGDAIGPTRVRLKSDLPGPDLPLLVSGWNRQVSSVGATLPTRGNHVAPYALYITESLRFSQGDSWKNPAPAAIESDPHRPRPGAYRKN